MSTKIVRPNFNSKRIDYNSLSPQKREELKQEISIHILFGEVCAMADIIMRTNERLNRLCEDFYGNVEQK